MPDRQPHDKPIAAVAEEGEVMLDGPNGIAISLTPSAAKTSAEQLSKAADDASRQSTELPPGGEPGQSD